MESLKDSVLGPILLVIFILILPLGQVLRFAHDTTLSVLLRYLFVAEEFEIASDWLSCSKLAPSEAKIKESCLLHVGWVSWKSTPVKLLGFTR